MIFRSKSDDANAASSALARWRARPRKELACRPITAERRDGKRRGVRLAWGKALDRSDRFLCDCHVVNRSPGGARLRLARKIALPAAFHFFDDGEGAIYAAEVAWRQGEVVGCRLALAPLRGMGEFVKRMSGRYYAVRG